jgi:hypothetical protein
MNQGGIERSSLVFKNCLVTTFRIQANLLLLAMLWDKNTKTLVRTIDAEVLTTLVYYQCTS